LAAAAAASLNQMPTAYTNHSGNGGYYDQRNFSSASYTNQQFGYINPSGGETNQNNYTSKVNYFALY
jgi:hypothetical protein